MTSFFKQWFLFSIPVMAIHYILILLIWGHDPAPVSQALVFPAISGNNTAIWSDIGFEIPKFAEILLAPWFVFWYLLNKNTLEINKHAVKLLLLVLASTALSFWFTMLGIMCFVATGSMIAKSKPLLPAITLVSFFCYISAYIMWSFPPISLGIIGWSFSLIALMIGFIIGVVIKPRKPIK